MKLDKFTQPGWVDAANYFPEWDEKYGTSKSKVPAVLDPQPDEVAAIPAPHYLEANTVLWYGLWKITNATRDF